MPAAYGSHKTITFCVSGAPVYRKVTSMFVVVAGDWLDQRCALILDFFPKGVDTSLLSALHLKMLRDRKGEKKGAANNRLK